VLGRFVSFRVGVVGQSEVGGEFRPRNVVLCVQKQLLVSEMEPFYVLGVFVGVVGEWYAKRLTSVNF